MSRRGHTPGTLSDAGLNDTVNIIILFLVIFGAAIIVTACLLNPIAGGLFSPALVDISATEVFSGDWQGAIKIRHMAGSAIQLTGNEPEFRILLIGPEGEARKVSPEQGLDAGEFRPGDRLYICQSGCNTTLRGGSPPEGITEPFSAGTWILEIIDKKHNIVIGREKIRIKSAFNPAR